MRAESLRGQGRVDEAVQLIRSRINANPDALTEIGSAMMSTYILAGAQQCERGLASCNPVKTAAAHQAAVALYVATAQVRSGVTDRQRSSAEQASLQLRLATQPAPQSPELSRLVELQRQRGTQAEGLDQMALPTQTMEDVVAALPPRVTLLVYALAEDDLVLWIFRRGVARIEHRPGAGRRVRTAASALQNELLDAMTDGWQPWAAELSRELIDPIGPLPDGEVLMIAADGILARTPFDVLQTRDGVPLGESHPTVFLESVVSFGDEAAPRSGSAAPVVIGVNGDGLFAAEKEARQIAEFLGTTPRLGVFDVGEMLAALRDAPIVHIAAHARISPENPYESFLALGGGQRLPAWELFRHAPAAELITLSACDTATESRIEPALASRQGPASSLVSFAFSGGARFALSSLWTASDAVTAELMAHFYAALARKTDVVHALHEAKRAVRRSGRSMHPHYYANFVLTGRSATVVASRLRGVD